MNALVSDTVIAGSTTDFMQVRHVILQGSQRQIGRELATIATRDLGVQKVPWTDPAATARQSSWLQRHWPAHYSRSQGVAEALGLPSDQDAIDTSFLYYYWAVPGCSNVFWPPATTSNRHATLSRNYDFSTGTAQELMNLPAPPEAQNATAAPFVMETRPEGPAAGYATLLISSYDLLGGATDGINSEGLGVALMATVDVMRGPGFAPLGKNGVGISEIQMVRYLLENAATAQEARQLLAKAPQYAMFVPCHFLVADASGDSFLWSHDISPHAPVLQNGHRHRPHCATNHIVGHQVADIPERQESVARRERLRTAMEAADSSNGADRQSILAASQSVAATLPAGQGQYAAVSPARTLWHAIYDLTDRSLSVDFYLGEGEGNTIRRSPRLQIQLRSGAQRDQTAFEMVA